MPLTAQQLQALETLEWVLDENIRASGKTTVLAVAAIRLACRHPGRTVRVYDHPHNGDGGPIMARAVEHLIRTDPRLFPRAHFQRLSSRMGAALRLDLAQPLTNWLPSEEALGRTQREEAPQQDVRTNMNGDVFLPPGLTAAQVGATLHASIEEHLRRFIGEPDAPLTAYRAAIEEQFVNNSVIRFGAALSRFGESIRFRIPAVPTVEIDSISKVEAEPKSRWEILMDGDD